MYKLKENIETDLNKMIIKLHDAIREREVCEKLNLINVTESYKGIVIKNAINNYNNIIKQLYDYILQLVKDEHKVIV